MQKKKIVKLVHQVGFIIKKSVTMQHGHMNAKFSYMFRYVIYTTFRENFVLYVVCFLLGNSPDSEFYMHLPAYEDGTDRVFRNVGI
jgi:hypothetical protein